MRRSLTAREKNLIAVAVTVIFCSLFLAYLILPAWNQFTEIRNRAAGKTGLVKQGEPGASGSQGIQDIKSELDGLRRQLPEKPDTAELLFYLNKAAEKTGVVLAGFSCENSTGGKVTSADNDLGSLYAKVQVIGTYAQIRAFVGQTEELPRITHNRVVTINETRDVPNKLEGLIEFSTFVASYGDSRYKNESDIPQAPTGKQTLFRY